MVEKVISVKVLANDIEKTTKETEALNKEIAKIKGESEDSTKALSSGAKNANTSVGGLKKGIQGIGLAFKALGIGLIVAAVAALAQAFGKNQKVADFFATTMEAVSMIMNDFVNFILDAFPKVSKFFSDVFENPKKFIIELGESIKENLIERLVSLLEVSGFLADAFVKLFKGDFAGALDSVKDAGKEMVDVFTGVDDALDKGVDIFNSATDAIGKYGSEIWKTSKATIDLRNNAQLAAAEQGRLVEKYDRLAEKQRQIRDEERNSIDDRIKANQELGKILDKQEKAMLSQAGLQVAAAQNEVNLNDTIENRVALTEALANKEGVLAQIEGFRSEQKVNEMNLERERLEMIKARQDAESELSIEDKKFNAERIKDKLLSLQTLQSINEQEKEVELQRLQAEIELYKLGTQARVDAEIAFNAKKQELLQNGITIQDNIDTEIFNRQKTKQETIFNNENESFMARLEALRAYNALVLETDQLTELEKQKLIQETANQERILQNQKLQLVADTAGQIAEILGKNSKVGKAFAIAQALMNTYLGVTSVLAAPSVFPEPFGTIQKIASIATVLATGFKAVKDITSVKTVGGGGGGAGAPSGGGGQAQAPSFNVVGTSGQNQIAQQLGQAQDPIQAFVVGSNVTTQQELDRNIVSTATIG